MRVLYAGYQAQERAAEDKRKGVKPEHRENLSDFNENLNSPGGFDDSVDDVSSQTPQNSF